MIVSALEVTCVSEKNRIRKVMFLKAPKLEHLDNVRNRCWDQNLAGIPEMGTSNVLGRTESKMGYNAKMQSRVRERQHADHAHLMEQMSKENSRIAGCQSGGRGGKPPHCEAPALAVYKPATHRPASEKELTTVGILLWVPMCAYVRSIY